MGSVCLRVSVPICGLRKGYAREFLETERVPPPATVYGFLLSLIGEEFRDTYAGSEIAVAVLRTPEVSTVLRTAWRVKSKKTGPGVGNNKRPDYQEILTGLEFLVWVREGHLAEKLKQLLNPREIVRYGGLSFGESRDLVDEVEFDPAVINADGQWLARDPAGEYPLPVWVDHVGSKGTRRVQCRLYTAGLDEPPPDDARWIRIEPPAIEKAK